MNINKNLASLVFPILSFLLLTCLSPCNSTNPSSKKLEFRGVFVFGNSILDNGNNNFLSTALKANYLPYGIDFPFGTTGRFTNNKNLVDRIGDLLKLPLLPAFADPQAKGGVISHGVNHASAGSGILDSTGSNMGVTSLNEQIQNFIKVTVPKLQAQQPGRQTIDLLQNYLFLFSTASNDFLGNFFQGRTKDASLEFFTANLTSSLAGQITKLYNVGARKFAFLNVGPLGCTPMARASMRNKECNEAFNYAAFLFNVQLVQMLDVITTQMPGFQSVVVNVFQITLEFIRNPSYGGFSDVSSPCCEVSEQSGGILCKGGGSVCSNRSSYLFFDALHPTEALYSIIATRAYSSNSTSEVYPFNIQRLAQV